MTKRWLFVTLLVAVLAAGIAGGAVLANGDGTEGNSPMESFVSRVATILGLEDAVVQDAFQQAARETRSEALQRKLDRLVDQGRLTLEQADEYKEWYQSRPEGPALGRSFGNRRHGFFGGRMFGGRGRHGMGFYNGLPPASDQGTVEQNSY